MIYLDDILIYLNNMYKHHQHVKEVLKCLFKAGLYAKVEKCEFHFKSVEYLGYILSPSGLTMSNDKVKIIQDWSGPKKVKNIQSFLGFTNFYYSLSSITWTLSFHWHILPKRTFSGSLTYLVVMFSILSKRHSPLLLFSLIGFLILNLLWKLILQTMLSL